MTYGIGCNNTSGLHGHKHDPLYKIRACFATALNT
jgi:hypothetical protein